jgi:FAD synthase
MTDQPQSREPFVVVRGEAPADHALDGAVVAIGNFDGVHRGTAP